MIFQVNTVRLMHYDPALERQTSMFDALQDALAAAVEALFRQAQTERDALPEGAREAKVLRSLIRHREGLSVFVDHPRVPMDNSEAERRFRDPVIGRRLSFGSDSESGAAFTAIMYLVTGTLAMNGLITLPPPRWRPGPRKPIVFGQDTEPPLFAPPTTLDEARPLDVSIVVSGTREGKLWNEFVARYHYLGYTTLVGAQMRYAVHDRNGWPVAMLGFSTAAWKLAPRDTLIGWTPEVRQKNLPLVIDNPRFLILPKVCS